MQAFTIVTNARSQATVCIMILVIFPVYFVAIARGGDESFLTRVEGADVRI